MLVSTDDIRSFTLRLPESLRSKLATEANSVGKSLNEHIQSVLETHVIEAGFCDDGVITPSRRAFKVEFCPDDLTGRRCLLGFFHLKEMRFGKRRAYYMLGIEEEVMEDWGLKPEPEVIREIGLIILHEYAKHHEIDCLFWKHPAGIDDFDGYRVFSERDLQAASLPEFLINVKAGRWTDTKLQVSNEGQDIRLRRRTLNDLYR